MRNDTLELFVRIRKELKDERGRLGLRLRQINDALGEMPLPSLSPIEDATVSAASKPSPGRRKMGRAARARISAAQKARWAKLRGDGSAAKSASSIGETKPRRKLSAAGRTAIADAARKRWAAAKAAGKSTL